MSTTNLESGLAQMFPPNLTLHRTGWVWRDGPVQIEYVLGYDEVGSPYMHEVGSEQPLEMTPMDSEADLQNRV